VSTPLFWKDEDVDEPIGRALRLLCEHYPLREGDGTQQLRFTADGPPGAYRLTRTANDVDIRYGTVSDALRGLGAVLAGRPGEGETLAEERPFGMLGIMLDCSRNAVMKPDHFKRWLRHLALLGYNTAMLYTEDTYTLPDEPFFGLFRGAYTPEELKDIDEYAAALGIEMIGCIQTLGHLEQILKWGAYKEVKDTDGELLAGEPETYELIRKMIERYAECYRSRRIHIGMDETWTLGRGRFLDINGHKPGEKILIEHLSKVVPICEEFGLRPMVWSDMLFQYSGGGALDSNLQSEIEDEIENVIPRTVDLVYWDYYSDQENHYSEFIERHRRLGREPLMASGVWTWHQLWYGRVRTEAYAGACIRASKQKDLKEIFFTMWGDDGGYCEYDSSLAGLAFAAGRCYDEDEAMMKHRFAAVCGIDYDIAVSAAGLDSRSIEGGPDAACEGMGSLALWDDPLIGMYWLAIKTTKPGHWDAVIEHYRRLANDLEPHRDTAEPIDLGYAAALADLMLAKLSFRKHLEAAYEKRDRRELQILIDEAPRIIEMVEEVERTFRRQWLRRNKPFGLETMQIRFGGLRQRYVEIERLLRELVVDERESIPELDEGLALEENVGKKLWFQSYRRLATPGIL